MNYTENRKNFLNQLKDEELFFKINNLYIVNDPEQGLLVIGPDNKDLSKYRIKRFIKRSPMSLALFLEEEEAIHEKIFESLQDALLEARSYIAQTTFPSGKKLKFLKISNTAYPATERQISYIKNLYDGVCEPNLTKSAANLLISTYEIKEIFKSRFFDLKNSFYIEGEIIYPEKLKKNKKQDNQYETLHEKPWMPGDDDLEEIQSLIKGYDLPHE